MSPTAPTVPAARTAPSSLGRPLHTGTDTSGELPVDYRFQAARNGNRHLLVVFANFDAPEDYGWSNGVLDGVRANVLWIRDRFDGHNSYYLCREGEFSVERSVAGLIDGFLAALALTRQDCTLLGSSKGASAALWFGLTYGFRNVLAIAPQFAIGSYVRRVHPVTARFMLGEDTDGAAARELDACLPDLVREGRNPGANLYVFSSPADAQYPEQIEPFLLLFHGHENFNFVFTDSPYVPDHTRVAGRNVPVVLGLVNLLADGMAPRLGFVRNGHEDPGADRTALHAHLAATARPGSWVAPPVVTSSAVLPGPEGPTARLAGTAPGAVAVQFWERGTRLGTAPVAPDGHWTWAPARAWPADRQVIRAFALTTDGAESERTSVTVSPDAVA
ncbi:hypothetical protein [Streptomyces sp. NPDC090025]|uniref:hypothetical protein n=1 Tax=Streptomyces sp. NPDC090025 TaxID=3365922 RepID=UPI00383748B2